MLRTERLAAAGEMQKENIEQLGVTRCFPEGRKILFFVRPSYRQAHDYDFSAKAFNVCLLL
jgi:hypothetical protein